MSAFPASLAVLATTAAFATGACQSRDYDAELDSVLLAVAKHVGDEAQTWHTGPDVHVSPDGPGRFVPGLYGAFDVERAFDRVRFVDAFYRAPANEGFELVLDRLEEELREAGFGGDDARFELRTIETAMDAPAWTPVSGRLALLGPNSAAEELHAFEDPTAVDRCMLPVNAPSCDVRGRVVLDAGAIEEGDVFVTEEPLRAVMDAAAARGAAAVVSASLASFNVDPREGGKRHLDAIQYRRLGPGVPLPVAQISPRSFGRICEAVEAGGAELELEVQVRLEERPLRTLVAAVVGDERPDEAIAVASHVQEPGACDNATGVAGQLEGALALAELLRAGELDWPSRTLVFLWGDEFVQTRAWLDDTSREPIAGISSDMTGQSRVETGAIALLERMPDPGALETLPPDEHSAWGAGQVSEASLRPNGFAIMARCAMVDVSMLEDGSWVTADHPWEGGSDHDVFIDRGLPAVLFWHFTDFTYHTSLDRMEMVDGAELRRTTTAILATALAVADPLPSDLERYTRSIAKEKTVRLEAAEAADSQETVDRWIAWCDGAREWLRYECLPALREEQGAGR